MLISIYCVTFKTWVKISFGIKLLKNNNNNKKNGKKKQTKKLQQLPRIL